MSSFTEEQLRGMIIELKAGTATFPSKLNSAKLDITQSSHNKVAFLRFETRTSDTNRKVKSLEDSDIERQGRKWRLHPEVFSRDVLIDLEQSRALKAELDQLFQDLEGFNLRAKRYENINRMGKSSLEMLNIVSTPQGSGSSGTSKSKKKSKVEKTVHVKEHWRRPPQRKPKPKTSKKN